MSDGPAEPGPAPHAPFNAPPPQAGWLRALKGAWSVVLAIVVLASAALYGLSELDDRLNAPWMEAKGFFRTFGREGADAAYARAAPKLRAAVDRTRFSRIAASARLDQVKGGGWNDRRLSGWTADMGGVLYLRDGAKLPHVVRLQRQGLRWKVTGFELPGAEPVGPPAPGIDRSPLQRAAAARLPALPPSPAEIAPTVAVSREGDIDAATGVPIAHPPRLDSP